MSTAVIYFCNLLVGLSVMVNLMVGLRFPFFFLFSGRSRCSFGGWLRCMLVWLSAVVGPSAGSMYLSCAEGGNQARLAPCGATRLPAPAWKLCPCQKHPSMLCSDLLQLPCTHVQGCFWWFLAVLEGLESSWAAHTSEPVQYT